MASLAAVVQGYLTMAEKKTEAAKQEAIDKVSISYFSSHASNLSKFSLFHLNPHFNRFK